MKLLSAVTAILLLAACNAQRPAAPALAEATADPLADAAALLAAAEAAPDAAARAPHIARLDALRVTAMDGATDDPLGQWRREAPGVREPVYRGRTLGPAYRRALIEPGKKMTIEQIFYAGQSAAIAAQTQGGQPVALKVRNPRTEPVCDRQLSPRATCRWLPLFTERYSIELENRAGKNASVYLVFR